MEDLSKYLLDQDPEEEFPLEEVNDLEEEDVEQDNDYEYDSEAEDEDLEDVGEDTDEDDEEGSTSEHEGSSPNVFSSIASMLREEGALRNISDEELQNIDSADSLSDLIKLKVEDSISDRNKFIRDSMLMGYEQDAINRVLYERDLYNSLDEDMLRDDSVENVREIRRELIISDYLNKGFSAEKAQRLYDKAEKAGDEIDDAIEALDSLRRLANDNFNRFNKALQDSIEDNRRAAAKYEADFKNKILNDKNIFGNFDITDSQRKAIYSALKETKYKNKKGEKYTEIDKWRMEDPDGYQASVGLMYILTKGGKDFSGILKNGAKKEIRKARKELENALRSSTIMDNGKLKVVNNYSTKKDKQSKYVDFDIQL